MLWNCYWFAHKMLRHFTTSEEMLKIDFTIEKKKIERPEPLNNLSLQECDECAYRHDAELWKWHTFTHIHTPTSWILTDEILTWPKCILWHGWCTFQLTADNAESLAQVSVNKSTSAHTVCEKIWKKVNKKWKSAYIQLYTDKAVHSCN